MHLMITHNATSVISIENVISTENNLTHTFPDIKEKLKYHAIYLRFNMPSHVTPYTLNELENLWTHTTR